MKSISIGEHTIDLVSKPILIAGPCVLEKEEDAGPLWAATHDEPGGV